MAQLSDLQAEQQRKQGVYPIRTQYLDEAGQPRYVNHLIYEHSPYLLQHAHNPVHWRAWSEQTFALAQTENKPIFLSIGYSACHWCHVMEEESFDNKQVAAVINNYFIPIKVDREQRPDLDEIYMSAVQLIGGHGGWPMSVFLTPNGQPFYGGTYFVREQFIDLLQQLGSMWHSDHSRVLNYAQKLTGAITKYLATIDTPMEFKWDLIAVVRQQTLQYVDREDGGFGSAPKFPQEPLLLFLLDQIAREQQPLTQIPEWEALSNSLNAMLKGGIYDHVGGGFHRYSVDSNWLVPHFEKMLYNQGQLCRVYNQAFRLCGNPEYQRIAEETLNYVVRDMISPEGLFYSATDADSEGEEGKYFVWAMEELQQLLGQNDFELLQHCFDISAQGNFEGANILNLVATSEQLAKHLNMEYNELHKRLRKIKETLYTRRQNRIPPLTDTKIITEWNAMVIAALAEAAMCYNNERFGAIAVKAAEKLWQLHRSDDDILRRISLNGSVSDAALLEDYAHFIDALLILFDYTSDQRWLNYALHLLNQLNKSFLDSDGGGFYVSPQTPVGPMLVRSKSLDDNATLSGNSMMQSVLARMARRTGDIGISQQMRKHLNAFAPRVQKSPMSAPYFLVGVAEVEAANPLYPQYAGGGALKVWLSKQASAIKVIFHFKPGWYIQQNNLQAQWQKENSEPAKMEKLQVSAIKQDQETLAVYNGKIELDLFKELNLKQISGPLTLLLTVELCDQRACYPPETIQLKYWPNQYAD